MLSAFVVSPAVADGRDAALRQVAGILDYIGGDYRGAVGANGEVLNAPEYREQLSLAGDASALARGAGLGEDDPVRRHLAALDTALRARRPPAEIAALCRDARAVIIERHRVVLAPKSPPRREVGERLYRNTGCPQCHGADGSADTETARTLEPRPANFLDPERVATVSPHRAFHALTFGVAGTTMTGYPALSDAERWDLAFYVLSMRHAPEAVSRGRALVAQAGTAIEVSPEALSAFDEATITARLGMLASDADRAAVLAYLRAAAPFERKVSTAGDEDFALARARIDEALGAYHAGNAAGARRLLVSAYLDGFEPQEAAIAARNATLVREVEGAMLRLRELAARGAPASEVDANAREVHALLARAASGRKPGDAATAFIGAFTITLREGIEAALLVVALLGIVRRQGLPHLARFVHAGWLLALPAGAITWVALGSVLGGLERELAEGIASLVAAIVLLGVTHWVIGQATARRFMGLVAERIDRAVRGRKAAFGILGLAFIAAYREAFEVVLFFQALLLDAGQAGANVGLGIAAGIACLAAVVFVLRTAGKRLKPRPFLLGSSALLALLALVLTGKGIRALQEAGIVPMHSVALPEAPLLGIHATAAGLLAQGVVLAAIAVSALLPWVRARRQAT